MAAGHSRRRRIGPVADHEQLSTLGRNLRSERCERDVEVTRTRSGGDHD